MPDSRKHRGQHPQDKTLFSVKTLPNLRAGVTDLSWLFSRGYSERSAVELVGNRYQLTKRQRQAIRAGACSDAALQKRQEKIIAATNIATKTILIDGYNLLINTESALSGGMVFIGRDGAYRDLASVHSTYRKVSETVPAIKLIGNSLQELKTSKVIWYFDAPISNSGRLSKFMQTIADEHQWPWEIYLDNNPDKVLMTSTDIVVSSDSLVLDNAQQWLNLPAYLIAKYIPDACLVQL